MLWKKQPVGSKIADLQTNKASKDAATQSAAGLMSAADKTKLDGIATGATAVSVVNNLNSDSTTSALSAAQGKALNSNLVYKNLGAFTAESGLISALDTEIASMSNYTQRAIRFNFTTADGAFGAYYYLGILSRGSAADYCSLFVETFSNKTNPHSIDGSKNGTWGFSNLSSNIAYDWNGFTNYVSSLETGATGIITRFGKMRSISFQGVTRTHTEDEVLATLPEADRPTAGAIFTSGNVGSSSVVIRIGKDGKITLYSLNGVTASGRVYFGATYAVG